MSFDLTDWFINYVGRDSDCVEELNIREANHEFDTDDSYDCEQEFHKMAFIGDSITMGRQAAGFERQLLNDALINSHKPARVPIDPIQEMRKIIKKIERGEKVECPNCRKDHFKFRTGKYGEFLFCPSCKCTTSESTVKRRIISCSDG
jgi:ssDNA-binding Zn-finger/Zn-ribbon topoisomerase 1